MFSHSAIMLHPLPITSYQDMFDMYEQINTIQHGVNLLNRMTGKCDHDLLYDTNLFRDYLLEYIDSCTDFDFTKKKRRQVSEKVLRTFHKDDISSRDIKFIIDKSVMTLDELVGF